MTIWHETWVVGFPPFPRGMPGGILGNAPCNPAYGGNPMHPRHWPRDADLDRDVESAIRRVCDGGVLERFMDAARQVLIPLGATPDDLDALMSAGTDIVTESVEAALIMERVTQMLVRRQRLAEPIGV